MSNYPFTAFKIVPTHQKMMRHFQWTLDPTFRGIKPFNFSLAASETPDFSEVVFAKDLGDTFYGVDDTLLKQNNLGSYLYRVTLITRDNKVYHSNVLNFFDKAENWQKYFTAREIVRKEFVRFRYTGQKNAYLLKRKNYGELNADELDPVSGVPLTDNTTDFGTGFVGGYHKPLQVIFSTENQQEHSSLNQQGMGFDHTEKLKIRMVGFPIVTPRDILVTEENIRYNFDSISTTYMPGTNIPIIQMADVTTIPPTDTIYNVVVP
jgi:hypothetical protein